MAVRAGRGADLLPRVAALCAEYARAIDDDRLEEWPDFFASPCLYKITSADNYRLSSLILGIVRSVPFQMRRSAAS